MTLYLISNHIQHVSRTSKECHSKNIMLTIYERRAKKVLGMFLGEVSSCSCIARQQYSINEQEVMLILPSSSVCKFVREVENQKGSREWTSQSHDLIRGSD